MKVMGKSGSTIDTRLIRELAELLTETGLTEIEIEQSGSRVRVSRAASATAVTHGMAPPTLAHAGETPATGLPDRSPDPAEHPGAVKSPMVGTAYRSPSPGAQPFVEVGAEVRQGQTVLIIEAMKTMNQIVAPHAGRVTDILVADGHPVEYGEPLLIIE